MLLAKLIDFEKGLILHISAASCALGFFSFLLLFKEIVFCRTKENQDEDYDKGRRVEEH